MLRNFFFYLILTISIFQLKGQEGVTTEFSKGIPFYSEARYDSAIYYFERARDIAYTVEGPSYWKGRTTNFLSLSLIDLDPERSLRLFNEALDNYHVTNDNGRISELYKDRATAFKKRGDRNEALILFEKGQNFIKENILDLGDSNAYMVMQRSIVSFHLEIGDTKRALEQLESSVIPQGTFAYEPYKQYADVYSQSGQLEKAVEYYYLALDHQKQESNYNISREDYKSANDSLRQLSQDSIALAYRMNSLAEGLLSLDRLAEAKAYLDTALTYMVNEDDEKVYIKNDLALYAIKSEEFYYAQELLDHLDKNLNSQADQVEFQQYYDLQMRLNAAIGDYESFDYWRLKKDSLDKKVYEEGRIIVIEAQRSFENARAEQIQLAQGETLLRRRMLNVVLGIGAIIFFGLFYYFMQNSKKMRLLSARNELLVREQNHRVKNNLQMINSLLSLQAGRLKDEQSKDVLKRSQSRIQAISLLNRSLYEQKDISVINLKAYVEELTQDVINSVTDQEVKYQLQVDELDIDIEKATSLGLIINELIVNSIKHGGESEASFELEIHQTKEVLTLHYKDHNQGFDLAQYKASRSFGKRLIELQSRQLKAELEIKDLSSFELNLVFTA